MKKICFGISVKKKITGAHIYIALFQTVSIITAIYIFAASGFTSILRTENAFSVVFEMGISFIPRLESFLLNFIYRSFLSEIAVFFGLLAVALALGIISDKVLSAGGKKAKITRIVFIALIVIDIAVRFIPLPFNSVFPTYVNIIALVLRVICLVLTVLDFVFEKKRTKKEH